MRVGVLDLEKQRRRDLRRYKPNTLLLFSKFTDLCRELSLDLLKSSDVMNEVVSHMQRMPHRRVECRPAVLNRMPRELLQIINKVAEQLKRRRHSAVARLDGCRESGAEKRLSMLELQLQSVGCGGMLLLLCRELLYKVLKIEVECFVCSSGLSQLSILGVNFVQKFLLTTVQPF